MVMHMSDGNAGSGMSPERLGAPTPAEIFLGHLHEISALRGQVRAKANGPELPEEGGNPEGGPTSLANLNQRIASHEQQLILARPVGPELANVLNERLGIYRRKLNNLNAEPERLRQVLIAAQQMPETYYRDIDPLRATLNE